MGNSASSENGAAASCPFQNIPELPEVPDDAKVYEQFQELLKVKGVTTVICDELSSIESLETQWAYICIDKAQDALKVLITPKDAVMQLQLILGQNWQLYRHQPALLSQLFRLFRISIIMHSKDWIDEFLRIEGMQAVVALLPQSAVANAAFTLSVNPSTTEGKVAVAETMRTQGLLTHLKSKKSSALLAIMYQEVLYFLFALSNLDQGIFAMAHAHEALFQRMLFLFSSANPLGIQNEGAITNNFRGRILKLFGIIACHSRSPQASILDAFNTYAALQPESRFDSICAYFVGHEEDPMFQSVLLSFINTLLNTTLEPKVRMSIREDLRQHGMVALLEKYIHEEHSKHPPNLLYQLQMYSKYAMNDTHRPHHRTKCVTQLSELLQELASFQSNPGHGKLERRMLSAQVGQVSDMNPTERSRRQVFTTDEGAAPIATVRRDCDLGASLAQLQQNICLLDTDLAEQLTDAVNALNSTMELIPRQVKQLSQEPPSPAKSGKAMQKMKNAASSPTKSRVMSSPFIKNLRRGIGISSPSFPKIEPKSPKGVHPFIPKVDTQALEHAKDAEATELSARSFSREDLHGEEVALESKTHETKNDEESVINMCSQENPKLANVGVLPKLSMDENEPGVVSESSSKGKKLRIRDMPSYGKFFKLLSMGAPASAVKAKMTMAGLKSDYLDTPDAEINEEGEKILSQQHTEDVFEVNPMACLPPPPPVNFRSNAAPSIPTYSINLDSKKGEECVETEKTTAALVKDNVQYAKFFKMLGMGIPSEIVKSKMKVAGLVPELLDTPDAVYATAMETSTNHSHSTESALSLPQPPTVIRSKIRPLYWQQYKDRVEIEGTVWEEIHHANADSCNNNDDGVSSENSYMHLNDGDLSDLASIFPAASVSRHASISTASLPNDNTPEARSNIASSPLSPRVVFLIDRSRSNNISIIMKQFRLSNEAIREAIMNLDLSVLNLERVQGLLKILPNDEETATINAFKGDTNTLNSAEKVLKELITIPRLQPRLLALQAKLQFPSLVAETQLKITQLKTACLEILHCHAFKCVLYIILQVGNCMNQGTHRGDAKGFSLMDLTKLDQIRSHDRKSTLLHYIAQLVRQKCGEAVQFYACLQSLPEMRNCCVQEIPQETEKVHQILDLIAREIKAQNQIEDYSDRFKSVMESFIAEAAPTATLLSEHWTEALYVTRDTLLRYDKEIKPDAVPERTLPASEFIKGNHSLLLNNASTFFLTVSEFGSALMKADRENVDKRAREEKQTVRSRSASTPSKDYKSSKIIERVADVKASDPEVKLETFKLRIQDRFSNSLSNQHGTKVACITSMQDQIALSNLGSLISNTDRMPSTWMSKSILGSSTAQKFDLMQKKQRNVKLPKKTHGKSAPRTVQSSKRGCETPLKKAFTDALSRSREKKISAHTRKQNEQMHLSQTLLLSDLDLTIGADAFVQPKTKQQRQAVMTDGRRLGKAYRRRSISRC